jgi:Protein of unknown function (DUF3175)
MAKQALRRKWPAEVTVHSDALDVRDRIFTSGDPDKIARSLKKSAEASDRRKSDPFRSAMTMLTFYINRVGKNRKTLEQAKDRIRVARARFRQRVMQHGRDVRGADRYHCIAGVAEAGRSQRSRITSTS